MDIQAFTLAVADEGISPDAFSLWGDRDDAHCLVRSPSGVEIYYSERGRRWEQVSFPTEGEALDALLTRLRADETSRLAFRSSHRGPETHG